MVRYLLFESKDVQRGISLAHQSQTRCLLGTLKYILKLQGT